MKYPSTPELIGAVEEIDKNGDINPIGDKIVGISVYREKNNLDGRVDIDVREMKKSHSNLVIRLQLPELMAALSCATLNAERED